MDDRAQAASWDRLALRYGAQERLELRAIDAALRLAVPVPGGRLVDLATGTGLLLRRLAALAARPREAVGIDLSAGMLARSGPLPEGWHLRRADAREVPLPDGCAGVVTCAYLLHLLDERERGEVLAEARRLLIEHPAARLVVVTVWVDGQRPLGRLAAHALRSAARMRPAAWGGLRPLDPAADLAAEGFALTRRVVLPRGGYPSLVLAAARRPSDDAPATAATPR